MASLYYTNGPAKNQYQRDMNSLEKIINTLQIPTQAVAGTINALTEGANPFKGAANYVKAHKDFTSLLEEKGVTDKGAIALGLVGNIALDPLTYTGFGELTTAGKAARAADILGDAAKLSGDIDKVHDAALTIDEVGQFGKTWGEQAVAKQRALVSFAGQPVAYGDKILQRTDQLSQYVGNSVVGQTVKKVFGDFKSVLPEWFRVRDLTRKGRYAKAVASLGEEMAGESKAYYDALEASGVAPEHAKDILRDATELSRPDIEHTNLTEYMTDSEYKKYIRTVWNGEAGKRNAPMQMFRNQQEGDRIEEAFPGRRRRPNVGAESIETGGSEFAEGVLDVKTGTAAARGRPLPRIDKIAAIETGKDAGQMIGKVIKRGKSGELFEDTTGLGTPNYFGLTDSWDFHGRMPDDLRKVYQDLGQHNTLKMVDRIEEAAANRYTMTHIADAIASVANKYTNVKDISSLVSPISRAVNYINTANAAYLRAERRTGLQVSELVGDFNYLKRLMTPEGRDAYVKATQELTSQSSAYDISVRFASQLKRDDLLRKLTITEINKLSMDGKLTLLTGGAKVKLFEDEPFFATFVRGTESKRAIEAANMTTDAIKVYGKEITGTVDNPVHPVIHAPEGYGFLPTRIAEDLGIRTYEAGRITRDVALPKDIVKVMNSHYERILSPAELQPALRGYDALQRMWKQLTLPIWPAYHARNLLSDFLMITHGADDYGLKVHTAIGAIKDATMGLIGKSDSINIGSEVKSWDEFKQMLDHYGLIDYSGGRLLDDLVLRPKGLKNFRKGLLGIEEKFTSQPVFQHALRAGQFRQNTVNAGYFLGLLRGGVPADIAALEVKKRLFDFQDLTDVEKQLMRRVFPFYSWLRHNIPYQVGAMLHRPAILTEIGHLRTASTGGQGPAGDTMLPNFLAQGLPLFLGGQKDKPEFARLKGLLPQADIMAISNPLQEAMNAATPLLKTPIEIASNYDSFQRQDLERYPGETAKRLGVDVSRRWVAPILDNLRPFSEVNNAFRDTPTVGKIQGFLLAKDYKIDSELQQRLAVFKLQEEEVRVKKMMYQAGARGDSGAIIRLRQYLVDVRKNPAKLLR